MGSNTIARYRLRALMAASSIGLLIGASLGAAYLGSQLAKDSHARQDAMRLMQLTALTRHGTLAKNSPVTVAAMARLDASASSSSSVVNAYDTRAINTTAMAIAMRFAPYGSAPVDSEDSVLQAQNIAAMRVSDDIRSRNNHLIRTNLVTEATPIETARVESDHPLIERLVRAAPAMVFKAHSQNDADCLAQAVYYEARGEGDDGMRAVAQVILNRVRHPAFPKTICAVVYQGAYQRTGCQFSFACNGAMAAPLEAWAWRRAKEVANDALNGYVMKAVGTSTHFHTLSVSPVWENNMTRIVTIGSHIFYQFRGHDSQIRSADGVVQPSDAMPAVIQASNVTPVTDAAATATVATNAPDANAAQLINTLQHSDATAMTAKPVTLSAKITGKAAEDITAALTAAPTAATPAPAPALTTTAKSGQ